VICLIKTMAAIAKRVFVLVAAFSVILLTLPVPPCDGKCRHQLQQFCHAAPDTKTQGTQCPACCHLSEQKTKNTATGRCKGACCMSNAGPSAVTENQSINLHTQNSPCIWADSVATVQQVAVKSVITSVETYLYSHNNAQAVLCVFVI
jgi:hypothetical protein